MRMIILKVILWPNDPTKKTRIIEFSPDKINIISGESATGKSAISSIVDYCLGSEKCSIPIGLIRSKASWFGLLLKLAHTEMLVARKNPGDQQSTSDLYLAEGLEVEIPEHIEKNSRVEDMKNRFNQIALLSSLDISPDENTNYGGRPSFRDMAAFNFQPQHIVANPYTLFFKADTTQHREKLKLVFPLVLRAVDSSTLLQQRELRDLEREHERLSRELQARQNAKNSWAAEIESYYLQALSLGILPESPSPNSDWNLDKYLIELQKLPGSIRKLDIPDMKEGTNEAAIKELNELIAEEDRVLLSLNTAKTRLGKIEQLSSSVEEYGNGLVKQEDRIQSIGWLESAIKKTYDCPMCGTTHSAENKHITDLIAIAGEYKALTSSVKSAPSKLDNEILTLRSELKELERNLSKVRQKKNYLESKSIEYATQKQSIRQIYLFVGRVEQALENVKSSSDSGELHIKLDRLQKRIIDLRNELDPQKQKAKLEAAIDLISRKITQYASMLKLEHSSENVTLDVNELSIRFNPVSGRKDYLWEVGSGQNWVGYHIAGLLSLHEFFLASSTSPVPSFLIIDQPSQVYFPEAWPSLEELPEGLEIDQPKTSADINGVKRIFNAFSSFIEATGGECQIIVTEHAGAITWQGIKHIHLVENWRQGHDDFLIPAAWLD